MKEFHFSCPSCQAPLRLRNRMLFDQTIDCPDCSRRIIVSTDAFDEVQSQVVEQPETAVADASETARPARSAALAALFRSPALVSRCVAGAIVLVVVIYLAMPGPRDSGAQNDRRATEDDPGDASVNADAQVERPADGEDENPAKTTVVGADAAAPDSNANATVPEASNVVIPLPGDPAAPVAGDIKAPGPEGLRAAPAIDDPIVVEIAPDAVQPNDGQPAAEPNMPDDVIPQQVDAPENKLPPADEASPPPRDIAAALAQRLVRFEVKTPGAVRDLLDSISEMAAVDIETADDVAPELLDEKITFSASETTIAAVLKTVLEQVGLQYVVEPNRILVRGTRRTTAQRKD